MATSIEYSHHIDDSDIALTPAARAKMADLLSEAGSDISGIRVFVSGGGCGGMTYGMTYAEHSEPHDSVLEDQGFNIYVDPIALNYLRGCEIDFRTDGPSPSFVFSNVFQSVGGSGACGGCGGGGF